MTPSALAGVLEAGKRLIAELSEVQIQAVREGAGNTNAAVLALRREELRGALAALTPAVESGECSGNTHEFAGGLVCRCGQVYVRGNEILSTTPPPTVPDYWYADGENMIPPKTPPPTDTQRPLAMPADRSRLIERAIQADDANCSTVPPPTEPEEELFQEVVEALDAVCQTENVGSYDRLIRKARVALARARGSK